MSSPKFVSNPNFDKWNQFTDKDGNEFTFGINPKPGPLNFKPYGEMMESFKNKRLERIAKKQEQLSTNNSDVEKNADMIG
tara:strand:- start:6681 stop:6920 length:240 start_codon:yes stop_codon:yes gene_type:complete